MLGSGKAQQRDRLVLAAAVALGSLSLLGAALTIHHYRDRRRLFLEGPRRIPKKPHKVRTHPLGREIARGD